MSPSPPLAEKNLQPYCTTPFLSCSEYSAHTGNAKISFPLDGAHIAIAIKEVVSMSRGSSEFPANTSAIASRAASSGNLD
ncbi:hypothetical protein ALO49_200284 [Pseudomonas savastanoi pv. retacarpa]|nr:hypothetical protein ALO49_200284 [Pseudomonas savastanoi pv. retacarpa]